MLVHLLKLVWNRKRANLLLMLEIFAAFLVVFGVIATALFTFQHYSKPNGYDYRDVWSIEISRSEAGIYTEWSDDDAQRVRDLAREVEALEPVVAVGYGSNRPYSNTASLTTWEFEGRHVEGEIVAASDGYRDAMHLDLVQGRWFEPADEALGWEPVVVNLELARTLFGDEDPIDRRLQDEDSEHDRRVIGVLRAWRRGGELEAPKPVYFMRAGETVKRGSEFRFVVARVAPGTLADFEELVTERLHALAPDWSFTVKTLAADRDDKFRDMVLPLLLSATVGGFLLLMVVLGLTGVMWQNVTRRTKEIGVRRAMGASRSDVHRQVVVEVMITAAFGLFLGGLLVIQLPLVAQFTGLTFGVVLTALAIAASFMILLAGVCGLYPGWTATRILPAEALHYE